MYSVQENIPIAAIYEYRTVSTRNYNYVDKFEYKTG